MLTADKQVLLSGFLGQLPEHVAARLAKAVEVDRLIGGVGLPHDEILSALRPQLRRPQVSQRLPTPQRLFCRPFEDMLAGAERKVKQKGRIARSSVEPIWKWLENELMPARLRELITMIREGVVNGREDEVGARLNELWHEASAALKSALGDEKSRIAAARKLGGVGIAEDAAEMALILAGARTVCELQKRLPKPIANLTETDIAYIRDLFDSLSQSDPDLAPYIALLVMGRLERPWEALRLAAIVSRKSNDTVIANTDMGAVGELLFSDLDGYTKKIQAMRPMDFDAEALLGSLAGFAELSSGIVRELGIRRDGKWGQRLGKDRTAVAAVMEGLLERAPKEILAGLPAVKVGAFGKGVRPLDVGRAPDPERVARAMRYAYLMVHCRVFAVAAAFSATLNEAMDETTFALRSYGEDILREVRAATPETRNTVYQHFAHTLDICRLVLGENEADFLRRRSRVTTAATA